MIQDAAMFIYLKYEEIAELLVGDNALERYTHEELKEYIKNLKDSKETN